MDAPAEYYSSRLTRKERSKTFVEELLKDSEFRKYTKKKFMVFPYNILFFFLVY